MSSLTITTIQTDLHWENKEANFRMLEDKFRNLQERTEIIILPEMFSTGFTMSPELLAESMDGETIRWMKEMAAKHRVILTGSVIIKEDNKFIVAKLFYSTFSQRNNLRIFIFEDENELAFGFSNLTKAEGKNSNLTMFYSEEEVLSRVTKSTNEAIFTKF